MPDIALNQMIAALPLPTLAIDDDERIVAINKAAIELLGVAELGRHYITGLRQPALVETVEQCLSDQIPRSVPFQAGERAQPTTYDVHIQSIEGRRTIILSFQDLSHMTEAGQMRRDFVANVSHELRTPLTSLMGFIETLQGPARDDDGARARFLDIMYGEAVRMNRLVGDLLSLSRVEANERVRPVERVEIGGILGAVKRNLNVLASDANVEFDTQIGDNPIHVQGDIDQLQQVFTNLIENAIKYGGKNRQVDITATIAENDPTLRMPAVRVTVADQGPGIDPHHLPRLTERFYRIDSHRSRALGGTGLGLAIVKHIINRHRGRLKITSKLGEGAQFTVILPLEPVSASK